MKAVERVRVGDPSCVAEARRVAASMARSLEFDATRVGEVSIVATELATNLLKHAGSGELVIRALAEGGGVGLELLSLDKGPGIARLSESLRDGYSTAGSPGTGLGAIRRLSATFDLYSRPGHGTAVLSRLWRGPAPAVSSDRPMAVGAVCLPVDGEEACGDAWAVRPTRKRVLCFMADGLGHGQFAAEASGLAVRVFEKHAECAPARLLELIHLALRSSRGAAAAVAELRLEERLVRYAGAGNISGQILALEGDRSMVSNHGTLGLTEHRCQEYSYPWPDGGLLVLHSDGLASRWKLDEHPGLRQQHPALIAGVLYRDHQRSRDDSSVMVLGEARSPA